MASRSAVDSMNDGSSVGGGCECTRLRFGMIVSAFDIPDKLTTTS